MPAPLYTTRIPVRWGDMDALGHVNNAAYLTYFEQARVEGLARLGTGWPPERGWVLAQASVVFKRPVAFPATAVVRVFAGPPGRSSLPTHYELTLEGDGAEVYATGEATLVWVDLTTGQAVPIPDDVRRALDALDADGATARR